MSHAKTADVNQMLFMMWTPVGPKNHTQYLTLASTPPGMPGTHSAYILVERRQREYPPILLRTFGYSRPILVPLRSLSLKPIPFGYKTPPIRFSQAGGQSAHKARPPNLELALTPLVSIYQMDPTTGRSTFWGGAYFGMPGS